MTETQVSSLRWRALDAHQKILADQEQSSSAADAQLVGEETPRFRAALESLGVEAGELEKVGSGENLALTVTVDGVRLDWYCVWSESRTSLEPAGRILAVQPCPTSTAHPWTRREVGDLAQLGYWLQHPPLCRDCARERRRVVSDYENHRAGVGTLTTGEATLISAVRLLLAEQKGGV